MRGTTGALYLDEFQALGVEGRGHIESYPPDTADERRICKIIANNLFITESSLRWAVWDAQHGKSERFKAIRDRLLSPPVRIMRHE